MGSSYCMMETCKCCNIIYNSTSLKTIIDFHPLDIFIKTIAAKSDLKFNESRELKHYYVRQSTALREAGSTTLLQKTEFLLRKTFTSHAIAVFKNASNTEIDIGL